MPSFFMVACLTGGTYTRATNRSFSTEEDAKAYAATVSGARLPIVLLEGVEFPITYKEVCPDSCNISDRDYLDAAREWLRFMMPGVAMGMLWTSHGGDGRADPWELERDPTAGPWEVRELKGWGFAVWSDDGGYVDDGGEHEYADDEHTLMPGGVTASMWDDEDEAQGEADGRNGDHEPTRHGHPWASGWCFIPDDRISTEELHAAGFTVALYTGADGDQYRCAGIDGGGYSYEGAHTVRLYHMYHANRSKYGHTVATADGQRTAA